MITKGERTKQHILQVAIKLFSKNSFKNVTIRQIAKEAGISPGLIYKYFDTQEAIYYAAMQYASHELLERLQTIEKLEQFVQEYLHHMFTSEVLFEIMTYFSLDQDHSKNFLPILNEINQLLDLFEQKISGPNAKVEAQLLFSTLNGLIISYKKIPNRDTEAKIAAIQKLADYYVSQLKKRL
ncbi:TetR/AcrR family transcriptional regulator [Solibacillus sp. FSL W7-1464]|uniref:TetR/AcrR family transcriptional regulator n=1 Tax=Solibacillus sp. FSL W7-1464 TaxID=2921706 RepID=UPI0030F92229